MHKYEVMIDFLTMIVVPCTILHIYLHGYLQIETPPSGCLQPIPICHCQSWNLKGYTIITHGLLNLVQLLFKQPVLYDVIYCLEIFVKYKHIHLPKLSTVIKQKNKQNWDEKPSVGNDRISKRLWSLGYHWSGNLYQHS